MSRCKNCVFWAPFRGDEPTIPKRATNACTARTVTFTDPDGKEQTAVTTQMRVHSEDDATRTKVMLESVPTPYYGVRTKPKHTCMYVKPKHQPRMVAEKVK